MEVVKQGDILHISGIKDPVLVVSNEKYNEMGEVLACPAMKNIVHNAIHPLVQIHHNQEETSAYIACEDPRHLDLKSRRYTKIGTIDLFQMMDVADILIGMIECI